MKKLAVGFAVALLTLASQAEYLLWYTVSGNESGYSDVASYLSSFDGLSSDSVYASVIAVKKDDNGKIVAKQTLVTQGFSSEWKIDGNSSVSLSALGDTASSYSYYIEIASTVSLQDASNPLGYNTTATTYEQLVSAGSITDSMTTIPQAAVWHGGSGTYKATPEPTSAMLMLLGVAGLALRRKQRKQA